MSAITVTAANVRVVFPRFAEIYPAVAGVALTAGQLVYFNSSGKLVLTNTGAGGTALCDGMALEAAGVGQATSLLVRGHVAGLTLAGAYRALVYGSDTAGGIGDAAGTTSLAVGRILPMSDSDYTKILYFFAPSFI
jgi:hypothetical protein